MVEPEQKKPSVMRDTLRGTLWTYAATYSGKAMLFLSTVLLARLLTKADYGLAGYALVFIGFLDVLNDLGIGDALIYHPDDEITKNTSFWLNIAVGLTLFAGTWLAAPLVGRYFNDMRSVPMTRALGLTYPILALGNIHSTLLTKRLNFKRKFIPNLASTTSKGLFSILLAWLGFGAWSLVWGQVAGTAVGVVAFWFVYSWLPRFDFSKRIAKPLLSFGMNMVAVDGLGVLFTNVDYLLVGRYMGAEALAVYTVAFRIPELLVKTLSNNVSTVLFPALSKVRHDPNAMNRGFLSAMRSVTLVTAPLALGLAAIARPMTLVFFTSKWAEAIPVLAAISIYTMIRSLTFNIGAAYKAQGRPDILSKLTFVKLVILVPTLWWAVAVAKTLVAVSWMQVVNALIAMVLNLIVAAWVLRLSYRKLLGTVWPATASGFVMMGAVLGLLFLLENVEVQPLVQMILGILAGALVYSACIWWLDREYLLKTLSRLASLLNRKWPVGGLREAGD